MEADRKPQTAPAQRRPIAKPVINSFEAVGSAVNVVDIAVWVVR